MGGGIDLSPENKCPTYSELNTAVSSFGGYKYIQGTTYSDNQLVKYDDLKYKFKIKGSIHIENTGETSLECYDLYFSFHHKDGTEMGGVEINGGYVLPNTTNVGVVVSSSYESNYYTVIGTTKAGDIAQIRMKCPHECTGLFVKLNDISLGNSTYAPALAEDGSYVINILNDLQTDICRDWTLSGSMVITDGTVYIESYLHWVFDGGNTVDAGYDNKLYLVLYDQLPSYFNGTSFSIIGVRADGTTSDPVTLSYMFDSDDVGNAPRQIEITSGLTASFNMSISEFTYVKVISINPSQNNIKSNGKEIVVDKINLG